MLLWNNWRNNPWKWPRWDSFNILNMGFAFRLEEAISLERFDNSLSVSLGCKWYILILSLVIYDPWDWRIKGDFVIIWWVSQVSLVVKNCLPMQVDLREVGLIPGLGRPPATPEEGTVTHSSILACRIPWTEEPGRLQSMEPQEERLKQLS